MSNGALKTESRTQKQPERLNDVNWKDNIEKARSKSSQFRGISPGENTLVTQLSFSGGTGSGAIAEMILNGDLPVPEHLVVVSADPGMEDQRSVDYILQTQERFREVGIRHEIVKTDLYGEFLRAANDKSTKRFDNIPFWTKNRETGKRGRLLQKCTQVYKIAAMKRVTRAYLSEHFGISEKSARIPENAVRCWIGFSSDEIHRVRVPNEKYIEFQYPLIAIKMTKADIKDYYSMIGRPMPPRSVCNACFANGLDYFKDMYYNRPDEWEKAVAVDEAARDLTHWGIRDECYVFRGLVPLKDLPGMQFDLNEYPLFKALGVDIPDDELQCNQGVCFL